MASNSIDIKYILGIIRRRSLLFLIPFVTAAVIGAAIVMSLPAIYSANATILVESQQIPEDLVKSTVTAQASERLQVIQQRVLTRENLLQIVDKFSLFKAEPGRSRSDIVDLMRERIEFQPVELLQTAARRRNDALTTAFVVEFSYENADTAMKVANELITFIVEEDVKTRTERASDTTKFLEKETERLATELALVQNQMSEFKLLNNDTLPEKLAFNMSLLEKTERGVADLQRELISNDEQMRLVKLEASVKTGGGVPLDAFAAVRKKLVEAKLEYEVKKATFAEKHPEMRMLKKSISALEKELAANPAPEESQENLPEGPDSQLYQERLRSLQQGREVLKEQQAKLEEDAKKLRYIVVKTPETGASLSVLERKEATLQKSLDDMAARFGQARLGERLEQDQRAEKFQIIEQPVLPQSPSKPNRPALLGAVLAAAFGLGAITSGAAEFLDSTIRRSADLERQLRQRPLVVIPYITTQQERRRARQKLLVSAVACLLLIALLLLLVHIYFRPLDELFYRLLSRFGV
jgi:polysaccharide chain length determinant protein (PEP-CTERM system associated)